MRTLIEIILSFCIYCLLQLIPITYEMITGLGPYGQGPFTIFISKYIVHIYVVIVVLTSILLYFCFERHGSRKYQIKNLLLLILVLVATMVLIIYKFPYLGTDEFVYNSLHGFIVGLWGVFDKSVDLVNSREGERELYSMFVKYIFLDEEHIIISFLSVILTKIYSLFGLIKERMLRK